MNIPARVIQQRPTITIEESAPNSKLINKKWKFIYYFGADRKPAHVSDTIMHITEFFQNNKYKTTYHSGETMVGEWHLSYTKSVLILKSRFRKDPVKSKEFKIKELTDSTLILTFEVWFGSATKRFKALK
ncbi:hypothetical protein [Adhaeribacter pallidiroseus]|uniref:hypothetical protein n=1 Tax=Adhaeribacter pallidiroseus TaxID=2072847 RepID=UPI0011C03C53|nr:hypothetical protein [Adhaeribacter pallidiroseus]